MGGFDISNLIIMLTSQVLIVILSKQVLFFVTESALLLYNLKLLVYYLFFV